MAHLRRGRRLVFGGNWLRRYYGGVQLVLIYISIVARTPDDTYGDAIYRTRSLNVKTNQVIFVS